MREQSAETDRPVEQEFLSVIREYERVIYKVCYLYANPNAPLNDLYQDVVLNLWKAYPKYRKECKISTWIYRIALNTCISFYRKEKNIPEIVSLTKEIDWSIEAHDPVNEMLEQLPEAIKKQQEENLNTERSLSIIEARLLQQAKNKAAVEQIAKELSEKQSVADRWAKLNKLIGSADGAKFKVIAQSYTLNLLLLHANKHLSYLSKRYKLQQVPGTLALQVVDCDMCDAIRTVYSISGGESFLISMALALGLSSLSSNNLNVESLFIDEGFGSLDAESLRTAMEALEQLQMQGRKIGVISHVQEMSERISVQVQVHKKVNGKSVLSVVG